MFRSSIAAIASYAFALSMIGTSLAIQCNQLQPRTGGNTFPNSSSVPPTRLGPNTSNVCYSLGVTAAYSSGNLRLTAYYPDLGGLPFVAGTNVTQNITLTNITTIAGCNQAMQSLASFWSTSCASLVPPLPGSTNPTCLAAYTCCDTNGCNKLVIPTLSAGRTAVFSALVLLFSLIATASTGLLI